MSKETIAVDIDDVLAVQAEAFIEYSNQTYGTSLTIDDYVEHWSEMWQINRAETEKRAAEYHLTGHHRSYLHKPEALPVLTKLADRYRLIVVTARRQDVKDITIEWIDEYFNGIFEEIYFAGIWDTITEHSHTATKADLCKDLRVTYLIDDQSKHCNAAAEAGITAIMFGDYSWSRHDAIHQGVVRCASWADVEKYFDRKD